MILIIAYLIGSFLAAWLVGAAIAFGTGDDQ